MGNPSYPLQPIPAIRQPFEQVVVNCVGPLPKTKNGNQFLLTIMCASCTQRRCLLITAPVVVKKKSTFGLPKCIQTDKGTNFTSTLFNQVLQQLNIKHITSSPYHPESQGALERFHQSLKTMLKTYCYSTHRDWDEGVPFVLFAVRDVVQESLGFSPAELVFRHTF